MELVYLWVEKYKNIENQGFNFSPRFRCEYDKDTQKLDIVDKEETGEFYPKNFFGDNINVTAIVGENGSGKSSVLELLVAGIYQNGFNEKNRNWRDIQKFILVFIDHVENEHIFTFSGEIEDKKFKEFSILGKKTQNIYDDYNVCKPNKIFLNLYPLIMDFSIMQRQLWNDLDNYKVDFSVEPSRDYLSSGPGCVSKIEPISFEANMKSNAIYFYKYASDELKSQMKIYDSKKIHITKKSRAISAKQLKEEMTLINEYFVKGHKFLKLSQNEIFSEFNIDEYSYKVNQIDNFLNIDEIDDNSLDFLSIFDLFLQVDIYNENENINFLHLSVGTQVFLSYFGLILKTLQKRVLKKEKGIFYICIDEIENSLHPLWQKEFLSFLLSFLDNELFKNIKMHLILITHSPFILSDLPKENIIFLNKYKEDDIEVKNGNQKIGNCKNVTKETNIETFGANIHTLLSHGFFMDGGLMGEFAKGKINDILSFHKKVEKIKENKAEVEKLKIVYLQEDNYKQTLKDKMWNIQSIIGDDYLKQVIKNHLIEIEKIVLGNDEAKKEEVKRLKAQIELLEK